MHMKALTLIAAMVLPGAALAQDAMTIATQSGACPGGVDTAEFSATGEITATCLDNPANQAVNDAARLAAGGDAGVTGLVGGLSGGGAVAAAAGFTVFVAALASGGDNNTSGTN